MKSLTIIGRRWFQKSYGNTYCTAQIVIDGETIHKTPEQYGYDDHYVDLAKKWLMENNYLPDMDEHGENLRIYCERKGIVYNYYALDVTRERDL